MGEAAALRHSLRGDLRTGLAHRQGDPDKVYGGQRHVLGVAGLWSPWRNPVTGEWELSFTMLTINADSHPLFMHMHRPDLKRPVEKQDKRMVVILPPAQFDPWLDASPQEAFEFMREYPPAELLTMTPEPLPLKAHKATPRAACRRAFCSHHLASWNYSGQELRVCQRYCGSRPVRNLAPEMVRLHEFAVQKGA